MLLEVQQAVCIPSFFDLHYEHDIPKRFPTSSLLPVSFTVFRPIAFFKLNSVEEAMAADLLDFSV